MDFMATECGILLTFLCLLHGMSVDGIAPCVLTNRVALVGEKNLQLAGISCTDDRSKVMVLQVLGIDEKKDKVIVSKNVKITLPFYLEPQQSSDSEDESASMCHYNVKKVDQTSAGVYKCWKNQVDGRTTTKVGIVFALLIVVDGKTSCALISSPCDVVWKYTCSMYLYVNDTYVNPSVEWRIDDVPQSDPSPLAVDAKAYPLTEYTFTFSIPRPEGTVIPTVTCIPKFTVKTDADNLPPGFAENPPTYKDAAYKDECLVPPPDPCKEKPPKKPDGPNEGDPADPNNSKDGEESEEGGEEEEYYKDYDESDGVGLFKRNNVIILMVGIAAVLLIGSKGTSGV